MIHGTHSLIVDGVHGNRDFSREESLQRDDRISTIENLQPCDEEGSSSGKTAWEIWLISFVSKFCGVVCVQGSPGLIPCRRLYNNRTLSAAIHNA